MMKWLPHKKLISDKDHKMCTYIGQSLTVLNKINKNIDIQYDTAISQMYKLDTYYTRLCTCINSPDI